LCNRNLLRSGREATILVAILTVRQDLIKACRCLLQLGCSAGRIARMATVDCERGGILNGTCV
jgi:hypothetical protein